MLAGSVVSSAVGGLGAGGGTAGEGSASSSGACTSGSSRPALRDHSRCGIPQRGSRLDQAQPDQSRERHRGHCAEGGRRVQRHGRAQHGQRAQRGQRACHAHQPRRPQAQEGAHHRRVELRARARHQLLARGGDRQSVPVRARRGHDLERVDHRDQSGRGRDLLAGQPCRVARPVPALVVGDDRLPARAQPAEQGPAVLRADLGVAPDHAPLLLVQRSRLVQDRRGDLQLADVVEERGPAQPIACGLVVAELRGEQVGVHAHALGVPTRRTVVVLQRGHEDQDPGDGLHRVARLGIDARLLQPLEQPLGARTARRDPQPRRRLAGEGQRHAQKPRERQESGGQPFDQRRTSETPQDQRHPPRDRAQRAGRRRQQPRDHDAREDPPRDGQQERQRSDGPRRSPARAPAPATASDYPVAPGDRRRVRQTVSPEVRAGGVTRSRRRRRAGCARRR